ncbi:MAG TPA: hypothetical protein V6C93_16690 [Allocoleopsis sp.]
MYRPTIRVLLGSASDRVLSHIGNPQLLTAGFFAMLSVCPATFTLLVKSILISPRCWRE